MPRASSASFTSSNRNAPAGSFGLSDRALRLLHEARLLVVMTLALYLVLVLGTYNPADPGWSHAAPVERIHNLGGRVGAWVADLLLYLFGMSAYLWLVLTGGLVWRELARLRENPDLWPNAVDEVLRFHSPVQVTARFALRDVEVAGCTVPRNALVVTMLGGANRDPEAFADPDRFDVARENARDHHAFSGGRHFCLGAALARLEGEVGLRTLFERFPDMQLAPGARRTRTRVLRGWERLPVTTGRVPVG